MASRILGYVPDENTRSVLIEKFYKESKITLWTKNCVICLSSNVSSYGGHVHRNTTSVIAGFCNEHSNVPSYCLTIQYCSGCYGAYNHRMGVREFGTGIKVRNL